MPLRDSPILSAGQSALAQLITLLEPLGRAHQQALKAVCLLSLLAFFLTNVSIKVPVVGTINVSMLDFLTRRSVATSAHDIQKPNLTSMFSGDGFQFNNLGSLICAAAVLGVMLHYLLTLVWVILTFAFKKTFPPLTLAWLGLAAQFPILFSLGARMVLGGVRSEAMSELQGNPFGAVGTAFLDQFSVQPGISMWILGLTSVAALLGAVALRRREKGSGDSTPSKPSNLSSWHPTSAFGIGRTPALPLAFGIASFLSCWIPRLVLSTILLAFIGLLFAFAGMIMASRNKRTSFVFPISGGIMCAIALLIALTAGRFSRKAWSEPQLIGKTLAGREWSKSLSVTQGNVQVVVARANVGTVWYRDAVNRPQSTGPYLTIGLGVANVSDTKKVDFETWRGTDFSVGRGAASLSDNYGNSYKRIGVTPAPNLLDPARDSASLRPTERFYDPVVFELPLQRVEWLHLELPARNFEGKGTLRFEIPGSKIKWPAPGEQ
jgi:hypothetical protein